MEAKLQSAFHEAGHCFRAWEFKSIAVRSVCLKQSELVEGGWDGDLNYKKSWFPDECLRFVAVAGLLSEAKAVASEGQNQAREVECTEQLVQAICNLIDNELPNQNGPPGWDIPVPISGHAHQIANISRADIEQIPPEDRTEDQIREALTQTAIFVNKAVHWKVISELALELERLAPKCFGAFRIFLIVSEAIEQEQAEPDADED